MHIHQLKNALREALKDLSLPLNSIELSFPKNLSHGDLSTNVAMIVFKELKSKGDSTYKSPLELAQTIVEKLSNDQKFTPNLLKGSYDLITALPPGFINFKLNPKLLFENLEKIITSNNNYGQNQLFADKNIIVEFTDPNPFKEFHIGHLYSNAVGEAICRLFENAGATVKRADYFGDVGLHVAKAIYALKKIVVEKNLDLDKFDLEDIYVKQKFLGEAYALGATRYESDEVARAEIDSLNTLLYLVAQSINEQAGWQSKIDYTPFNTYQGTDLDLIKKIYALGRKWSLAYFETLYKRLGTQFDYYYPESKTAEIGYGLVQQGLEDGIFFKSNQAIVFNGEKYGLHTRVFVNKLGLPTYETKELGLAPLKYEDFPYDLSFVITANEINEYFKVLLKALSLINPKLAKKTTHLGHGMVKLSTGKMSSRTGRVITGDYLLNHTKELVMQMMASSKSAQVNESKADDLAVGAIKYAFLKTNFTADTTFDVNAAINIQGDTGAYLQYTHARACSVSAIKKQLTSYQENDYALHELESNLLRCLIKFPQVIIEATQKLSPHLICTYLYQLSGYYNTMYSELSIQNADSDLRLKLSRATAISLNKGLSLLGINAPTSL